MSDFVTLTCPSCGGKLQITKDVDRFACGYCGKEHVVKRSGGIIALASVVQGLATELTLRRLRDEIPDLEREVIRLAREAEEKDYRAVCKGFIEMGNGHFDWDYLSLSATDVERLVAAMPVSSEARPLFATLLCVKRDLERKLLQVEKLKGDFLE